MIRLFCQILSQIVRHRTSPFTLSISSAYFYPTPSKFIINRLNSGPLQSLTLSYLQKSRGLSLESAVSASKKLELDSTKKPDLVLNLLRKYGLTQTHIKYLITNRPILLLADKDNTLKSNLEVFKSLGISGNSLAKMLSKEPRVLDVDAKTVVEFFRENGFSDKQITILTMKRPILYLCRAHKNFKPKLEFFKSLGFSELDIAQILSAEPYILERSLENTIMPCVQVLRRVVGDDSNVLKVIKASYRILEVNVKKMLEPNMLLLANHGVPESFDIEAVRSMSMTNKALWDRKLEAYRSFGLSNDEIHLAFKLQPMCMLSSEKKIRKLMDFFVNKLNISPSVISKNPNLMLLSLEKRILPRCSVLNILMSKELINEGFKLIYMLRMTEKMFGKNVVTKYQDLVPEIVEAHQGRVEFQGFSRDLKM
ncbi:conserved hypothetical protein [Ricinus communis]|uniref:Uncharacterized protein n=1 Tax=Ricinus communis TaxID=3988 RepID=B9RAI7_RICCO|nr:conserved hypothetical protein [Ricinus communis]